MLNRRNKALVVAIVGAMFAIGAIAETALAQKASVPKPQDKLALAENEVKQLLLLLDTNKKGKISKQEWMGFMEAEFERLDKNKSGELDVSELRESKLQVSHFVEVGK